MGADPGGCGEAPQFLVTMAVLFPVWSPQGRLPAHPTAQGSRPSETSSSRTPMASCVCSGSSQSGGARHVLTMVKKLLSGSWQKPVLRSCTLSPAWGAGGPGDMLACSARSRRGVGLFLCPPLPDKWTGLQVRASLGRVSEAATSRAGDHEGPRRGEEHRSAWGHGLSQACAGPHLRTPPSSPGGPLSAHLRSFSAGHTRGGGSAGPSGIGVSGWPWLSRSSG